MKCIAIAGSLREGSYNRALLRAAKDLAPDGFEISIASIADIPLYNADEQAKGFPAPVERLAGLIRDADVVMIATPEYNYSLPGVLKNAIDWVSRIDKQPFNNKAIAILGASAGALGTARAQYHMRQVFVFLGGLVMNRPEVFVGSAQTKFDENGELTHQETRDFLRMYLVEVEVWARQVARMVG